MAGELELLGRGLVAALGMVTAGHHLAAAAALRRAPHLVKGFSLPLTVAGAVGAVFMAVAGDLHAALAAVGVMAGGMCITELCVWRAGAYISESLDLQAEVQRRAAQQVALIKRDMYADAEIVALMEDENERRQHAQAHH